MDDTSHSIPRYVERQITRDEYAELDPWDKSEAADPLLADLYFTKSKLKKKKKKDESTDDVV